MDVFVYSVLPFSDFEILYSYRYLAPQLYNKRVSDLTEVFDVLAAAIQHDDRYLFRALQRFSRKATRCDLFRNIQVLTLNELTTATSPPRQIGLELLSGRLQVDMFDYHLIDRFADDLELGPVVKSLLSSCWCGEQTLEEFLIELSRGFNPWGVVRRLVNTLSQDLGMRKCPSLFMPNSVGRYFRLLTAVEEANLREHITLAVSRGVWSLLYQELLEETPVLGYYPISDEEDGEQLRQYTLTELFYRRLFGLRWMRTWRTALRDVNRYCEIPLLISDLTFGKSASGIYRAAQRVVDEVVFTLGPELREPERLVEVILSARTKSGDASLLSDDSATVFFSLLLKSRPSRAKALFLAESELSPRTLQCLTTALSQHPRFDQLKLSQLDDS